ncbi:hypothetical protein K438DRAFT_1766377 [Mycena galopus ATCC 62051]|nr:hypothetical protein K438DRAFT_1766377 [Mycena galopus ATCC 62051]
MPSVRVPGAPIQCAVEGAQPPWFQLGCQTHRGAGKERDLLEKNDSFRYRDCKDSMPEYSDIHYKINTLVANSTDRLNFLRSAYWLMINGPKKSEKIRRYIRYSYGREPTGVVGKYGRHISTCMSHEEVGREGLGIPRHSSA